MLLFSVLDFISDNRRHFNELNGQVREYLVKPIKIVASYGILYLFCELGDTQIYRFFPIHRLTNLRSANIKFELYFDTPIPLPCSKLESEWMFIGQKEKAVLRIKTERLGEFTEHFGGEYKVICSYAALTELELFTDLRALKGLILSFGADIEVLSPTKLRRAVATELQAAVIKYSETRRLRGTK
jgi:predicted DNA-binding transcriptional regulator YafY